MHVEFDSRRAPMENITLTFSLINPAAPVPRRSITVKLDEAAVCGITEVCATPTPYNLHPKNSTPPSPHTPHLNPAPYTLP